jgi:hypothetical protein
MSQDIFIGPRAAYVTGIFVFAVSAITGCSYSVTFSDCEVTCQGSDTCPDSFTCVSGLCREPGQTGSCVAPGETTLRQTTDDKVDRNLAFGCTNTDGTTPEGSSYRVFSLASAGIAGTFHLDKVTLGICFAVAGAGSGSDAEPTVTIKVGTYGGGSMDNTLDLTKVTALKSTSVAIPATQITELVDAPIAADVPGGKNLIVEIEVADLNGTGKQVTIGSTANAQTQPAYLRSTLCGFTQPTSTTTAGEPNAHFVITATGHQ